MKIALVTELFPPSVGGQEIRFKEFAEEFARLGHSVDVFTIDHTGKLPAEETVNRVRILRTYRDANYYKRVLRKGRTRTAKSLANLQISLFPLLCVEQTLANGRLSKPTW